MAYAAWSVIAGEQPTAAKWNILGTNDASFNDGTGILAGSLTADKIASDAWTTWTPVLGNTAGAPAIGNGTATGKYYKAGRNVWGWASIVGGSTTNWGTGSFTITKPVNSAVTMADGFPIIGGQATFGDFGVQEVIGYPVQFGADKFKLNYIKGADAAANIFAAGQGGPFTFGTNDWIYLTFLFEAAS